MLRAASIIATKTLKTLTSVVFYVTEWGSNIKYWNNWRWNESISLYKQIEYASTNWLVFMIYFPFQVQL